MAFPTTTLLDDFNRADNANLGTNWTNPIFPTDAVIPVSSNQAAKAAGSWGSEYYNVATYGADCEVWGKFVANSNGFEIMARLVTPGTSGVDGYMLDLTGSTWSLWKIVNNSQTQLGSGVTQAVSSGDFVGLECVGTTITAYYKAAGGSWASVLSRTDSSVSSAGNVGFAANGGTIDDFSGGTVSGGGSPQSVSVTGKGSAAAFGSVKTNLRFSVAGLGSAAAFGTVTAVPGAVLTPVSGLGSAAAFGAVTPVAGGTTIAISGRGSAAAFGSVSTGGGSTVAVSGLGSAAAFGSVTPVPGGVTKQVPGLGSAAAFSAVQTQGGVGPTFNPAIHGGKHR